MKAPSLSVSSTQFFGSALQVTPHFAVRHAGGLHRPVSALYDVLDDPANDEQCPRDVPGDGEDAVEAAVTLSLVASALDVLLRARCAQAVGVRQERRPSC
ncbi:hypothetical protein NR798_06420 [Archangium gephyra]|uniref:hypothetical protein n=1 Tax=Archangium gephyra TaxID=48 RepID=UPI0035D3FC4E